MTSAGCLSYPYYSQRMIPARDQILLLPGDGNGCGCCSSPLSVCEMSRAVFDLLGKGRPADLHCIFTAARVTEHVRYEASASRSLSDSVGFEKGTERDHEMGANAGNCAQERNVARISQ